MQETQQQTFNLFNIGINLLSLLYTRTGLHVTLQHTNEKKKKSMYLEQYLNIDVHVHALHDPLFWFDIWRSPLIAQNKHVALTTIFQLMKKKKKKKEQDCWEPDLVCKSWAENIITDGSGRKTPVSGGARGDRLLLLSVFIYEHIVKISLHRQPPFWTSSAFKLVSEQK